METIDTVQNSKELKIQEDITVVVEEKEVDNGVIVEDELEESFIVEKVLSKEETIEFLRSLGIEI